MSDEHATFNLDRAALDLIKRTYAKGTSDAEFDLFVGVCKRLGLDPMAGQIYCMPTFDGDGGRTFKPVVSIDGFRSIAEESGEYEGQTKPEWFDVDTNTWVDVWYGSDSPVAARIGVIRKGFREPLYRVARYDAYVQTTKDGKPNRQWRKMGAEQLLKCAEALALRAAFPRKLAGAYTNDEMGQAQNEDVPRAQPDARDAQLQRAAAQQLRSQTKHDPSRDRAAFRWKANPKYDGTFVCDAPSGVIVEYIAYLNNVLSDESLTKVHAEVLTLRKRCEDILRVQLLAEQQAQPKAPQLPDRATANLDIGGALQAIVDGRLGDPSDTNGSWGMEGEESTQEA